MTTSIGRVTLPEVSLWDEDGAGGVRVGGLLEADTVAEASWLRLQLLGLSIGGEVGVPLNTDHDPDRGGWYRVLGVDVDSVLGMTETRGDRRWSAQLQRLAAGSQARMEVIRTATTRANVHGLSGTTTDAPILLPGTASAVDLGVSSSTYARDNRSIDGGTVARIRESANTSTLFDTIASYAVDLADVYMGAATVEVQQEAAGVWRTVVGRELAGVPHAIRLSNGLVRFTLAAGTSLIDADVWTGAAWVSIAHHILTRGAAAWGGEVVQVRLLANRAEQVTVRAVFESSVDDERVTLDLLMMRGWQHVEGKVKSRAGYQWGVATVDAGAGQTSLPSSSGIRRTATEDNLRWFMATPRAFTADEDTPQHTIYADVASSSFDFGVGYGIGTSAGGANPISVEFGARMYWPTDYDRVEVSGL